MRLVHRASFCAPPRRLRIGLNIQKRRERCSLCVPPCAASGSLCPAAPAVPTELRPLRILNRSVGTAMRCRMRNTLHLPLATTHFCLKRVLWRMTIHHLRRSYDQTTDRGLTRVPAAAVGARNYFQQRAPLVRSLSVLVHRAFLPRFLSFAVCACTLDSRERLTQRCVSHCFRAPASARRPARIVVFQHIAIAQKRASV